MNVSLYFIHMHTMFLCLRRPRQQLTEIISAPDCLTLTRHLEPLHLITAYGFVVNHPAKFSSNVLPKYFKSSNFSSFVRQLHFYNFRKDDARSTKVRRFISSSIPISCVSLVVTVNIIILKRNPHHKLLSNIYLLYKDEMALFASFFPTRAYGSLTEHCAEDCRRLDRHLQGGFRRAQTRIE